MSIATATEPWRMSATELAEAIRSKEASSREVVEAHLRRIEAVNPSINAVTIVLGERALEAAKAADGLIAAGGDLSPFHGVPFTTKGSIDVAGTPTTQGAKALAGVYPATDAPIVERMRAAGAIPIGRTNLPTYAISWHTELAEPIRVALVLDPAGVGTAEQVQDGVRRPAGPWRRLATPSMRSSRHRSIRRQGHCWTCSTLPASDPRTWRPTSPRCRPTRSGGCSSSPRCLVNQTPLAGGPDHAVGGRGLAPGDRCPRGPRRQRAARPDGTEVMTYDNVEC